MHRPATPIPHISLVQQIVQNLEQQIISGALRPGQRIIEQSISEAFGVSRSPVREACRVLESQGLVVHCPRKGIFVSSLSPEEAEEIYLIRANLESLATQLAVKRQEPNVLRKLKKIHRQTAEAVARNDFRSYFRLNLQFHETIHAACKSERLVQLLDIFSKKIRRYRFKLLSSEGRMQESQSHHEKLLHFFETRDADGAEKFRRSTILSNIPKLSERIIPGGIREP